MSATMSRSPTRSFLAADERVVGVSCLALLPALTKGALELLRLVWVVLELARRAYCRGGWKVMLFGLSLYRYSPGEGTQDISRP